jgi:Fe-S-cluster-containing hydrogenase component 2
MHEFSVVVGWPCQIRGVTNLKSFGGHYAEPRRLPSVRRLSFDLAICVPCGERPCQVCLEYEGVGDVALWRDQSGNDTLAWATSRVGCEVMELLAWPQADDTQKYVQLRRDADQRREASRRVIQAKQEAGELILLPYLGDSEAARGAMQYQDYYVAEANVTGLDLCSACRMCAAACPTKSISQRGEHMHKHGECVAQTCGVCFAACPQIHWQQSLIRGDMPSPAQPQSSIRQTSMDLPEASTRIEQALRGKYEALRWNHLSNVCPPPGVVPVGDGEAAESARC